MRILFDQGTPVPLRHALVGHSVSTTYEMAWTQLSNSELLLAAEKHFDVLITTDQNLRHQQNTASYRIAILVLPTTNWPKIRSHQAEVAASVNRLRRGDFIELSFK